MQVSFIICTYNPDLVLLQRTIQSILCQQGKGEIIVIDNRSNPKIRRNDLPKDSRIQLEVEDRPGLTAARIRGARIAREELLIFVDDDNILAPDYSQVAQRLAIDHPDAGVFSANIQGEFITSPKPWMTPYLPYLAINTVAEDRFSSDSKGGTMPVGAGMVVRRHVMMQYASELQSNPMRMALDRNDSSLLAGGDTDIGYTSLSLGLKCGWCKNLNLIHVIPSERLKPQYLRKIVRDVTASHYLLACIHGESTPSKRKRHKWKWLSSISHFIPETHRLRFRAERATGKLKGHQLYESCEHIKKEKY